MKKIGLTLTSLLLLLAGAPQAAAQWHIGLELGYSHNSLYQSRTFDYTRQYRPFGGFTAGIPVRYDFNDWFALQADLSFTHKNYLNYPTSTLSQGGYMLTNSYLELPLMARFSFGGARLHGFLNLGAYVGWWADSHIIGVSRTNFGSEPVVSINEQVPFDPRRDNRFEAGLAAGAGLAYRVSELIELTAEARYLYGLTDLQKNYMLRQVPRYNSTWLFRIGIMFSLPTNR